MTRRLLWLGFAAVAVFATPRVAQAQAHTHCMFSFDGQPCPAAPRTLPGLNDATFGPAVFVRRPAVLPKFVAVTGSGHRHGVVPKEPLKAARPAEPPNPCGTPTHQLPFMPWPCVLGPKK